MKTWILLSAGICAFQAASGQDVYPDRPVHIIVPYTPGTGADILSRVLSPKLSERWKSAVVTDNRPGATGSIGGAVAELAGGQVQEMMSATQTVGPHVQSGRLRMLAVLSAQRSPAFADVPTLKEQGLPDLEVETWYAMFAPAGTPGAVVERVNAELNQLLRQADIQDMLAKQGLAAAGGRPERLGRLVNMELARWKRVVKAAGIKAD